eukprot:scaffold2866_cov148-Isochrysis_galbana.AAC.5
MHHRAHPLRCRLGRARLLCPAGPTKVHPIPVPQAHLPWSLVTGARRVQTAADTVRHAIKGYFGLGVLFVYLERPPQQGQLQLLFRQGHGQAGLGDRNTAEEAAAEDPAVAPPDGALAAQQEAVLAVEGVRRRVGGLVQAFYGCQAERRALDLGPVRSGSILGPEPRPVRLDVHERGWGTQPQPKVAVEDGLVDCTREGAETADQPLVPAALIHVVVLVAHPADPVADAVQELALVPAIPRAC